MSDAITRLQRGPFWFLAVLIPKSRRRQACVARAEHKPELIDMGRSKICWKCGTW